MMGKKMRAGIVATAWAATCSQAIALCLPTCDGTRLAQAVEVQFPKLTVKRTLIYGQNSKQIIHENRLDSG